MAPQTGPLGEGKISKLSTFRCFLMEENLLFPLVALLGRYPTGIPPKNPFKKHYFSREKICCPFRFVTSEREQEVEEEEEKEDKAIWMSPLLF